MQIWKAKLRLVMNDDEVTWSKKFTVETDELEYTYDGEHEFYREDNPKEIFSRNYISSYYTLAYNGGWIKVEKGFSYQPSDKELELIEKDMTEMIRKHLVEQSNIFHKQEMAKIKALRGE